jgi:hypothetical protein
MCYSVLERGTFGHWDAAKNKAVTFKPNGLLKKPFLPGCSKMGRCKAPEILRNEAYLVVRRNDEG